MALFESGDLRRGEWRREVVANIVVAVAYGLFASSSAAAFSTVPRVSTALLFFKETLDTVFFLFRRVPKKVSFRPLSWLIAIGGSVAPLLLRPAGSADFMVGSVIQYVGFSLQIVAIMSLNRSFGVVPANRGIQTGGMYRFVRHPLYSAYTVALLGFLLNNFSYRNLAIYILATAFHVVRIGREEELLLEDLDYREYARRTRWKMAPFIY